MPNISMSQLPEYAAKQIYLVRSRRIMLGPDLATLYGVPTKALNQAVKRNRGRFPGDFMFQLSKKEFSELVTICDQLKSLKHSYHLPYAFTEQGVAMLSSVLNSERAIRVNIEIMRAFIRTRLAEGSHRDLLSKIEQLEKKYDAQFQVVFRAIKVLLQERLKGKRRFEL